LEKNTQQTEKRTEKNDEIMKIIIMMESFYDVEHKRRAREKP
jgi:hypothetical protein